MVATDGPGMARRHSQQWTLCGCRPQLHGITGRSKACLLGRATESFVQIRSNTFQFHSSALPLFAIATLTLSIQLLR